MKILTPGELKNLSIRQRGNLSPAYNAVLKLETGQTLHLEPKDWNRKTSPSLMLRKIMKQHGTKYTLATLLNQPGWLVTRVS